MESTLHRKAQTASCQYPNLHSRWFHLREGGTLGLWFAYAIGGVETDQSQALLGLTSHAGFVAYNISAIFFSIGSILFCYLFFKSRYIQHTACLPRSS